MPAAELSPDTGGSASAFLRRTGARLAVAFAGAFRAATFFTATFFDFGAADFADAAFDAAALGAAAFAAAFFGAAFFAVARVAFFGAAFFAVARVAVFAAFLAAGFFGTAVLFVAAFFGAAFLVAALTASAMALGRVVFASLVTCRNSFFAVLEDADHPNGCSRGPFRNMQTPRGWTVARVGIAATRRACFLPALLRGRLRLSRIELRPIDRAFPVARTCRHLLHPSANRSCACSLRYPRLARACQ